MTRYAAVKARFCGAALFDSAWRGFEDVAAFYAGLVLEVWRWDGHVCGVGAVYFVVVRGVLSEAVR